MSTENLSGVQHQQLEVELEQLLEVDGVLPSHREFAPSQDAHDIHVIDRSQRRVVRVLVLAAFCVCAELQEATRRQDKFLLMFCRFLSFAIQ